MDTNLVLSVFHGADLLGRGFEQEGFCVVRAAEIELGFDVRDFHAPRGRFNGIIAGTPCQDFSRARRTAPTGYGDEMLKEFRRLITEGEPDWFLLENVPTVPDLEPIEGYKIQRFDLNARECGIKQNRPRHFQFGSKHGLVLTIDRQQKLENVEPCLTASEGKKHKRRDFGDFCELQGLPRNFDLPFLTTANKYKAIGNGVAVPMARMIALAIRDALEIFQRAPGHFLTVKLCACFCGRRVTGKQKAATAACRKRLERRRNVTCQDNALPGKSHLQT